MEQVQSMSDVGHWLFFFLPDP